MASASCIGQCQPKTKATNDQTVQKIKMTITIVSNLYSWLVLKISEVLGVSDSTLGSKKGFSSQGKRP